MNDHSKPQVNTLHDVLLLLPQLYSDSSAKVYQAAFNRVEKLTGQKLAMLPADDKAWADLSGAIVWAGQFKGRTQEATERAFDAWQGKISAAIRRAKEHAVPPPATDSTTSQAWALLSGYVKEAENSFNSEGKRILANMSSLSIQNLKARLQHVPPAGVTHEVAEAALLALPSDKVATFRRSVRFLDRLIAERKRHGAIDALLPAAAIGPLRTLRDAPTTWSRFSPSFQSSLDQLISVGIRGRAPEHDRFDGKLGDDPLAARRAARKHRRKSVGNPEAARKSYLSALSWLVRHASSDRDDIYALSDITDLLTAEHIDSAVQRFVKRTAQDPALIDATGTSSLGTYLATLSTIVRSNELNVEILNAIEDARWEHVSYQMNEMSSEREAFVKKLDRDPGIVRTILSGPRTLMREAQRDQARWDTLSSAAKYRCLHLAMAAAMLGLQLGRPLRTKNVHELTISGPSAELQAPNNKNDQAWIDIARKRIKNRRLIESPLPDASWDALRIWIDEGRPRWIALEAVIDNDFLFPGSSAVGAVSRQTINKTWNLGMNRLGVIGMTPHMMRHVAATILLARYPGQYSAAADLLGDSTETVEAFYARGAGKAAARLFADVLEELDPSLKLSKRGR
ncbi:MULTISPECIES: tyrosine-type recombinase/integrase [unclassified Yoonia]|uniref:tyrosine-type recombinase/integrase n=1 Tax=unclassified Yoonia TaxID=2629118 RepID=UPI002AFEA2AE|nr:MULTISPECIES: tyrosine-type recombinase/integrase [unclassified Yoonia]